MKNSIIRSISLILVILSLMTVMVISTGCTEASAASPYVTTNEINGVIINGLSGYQYDPDNDCYILDFCLDWNVVGNITVATFKEVSDRHFEYVQINDDTIHVTKKSELRWTVVSKTLEEAITLSQKDIFIDGSFYNFNLITEDSNVTDSDTAYEWFTTLVNDGKINPEFTFSNIDGVVAMISVNNYTVTYGGSTHLITQREEKIINQ